MFVFSFSIDKIPAINNMLTRIRHYSTLFFTKFSFHIVEQLPIYFGSNDFRYCEMTVNKFIKVPIIDGYKGGECKVYSINEYVFRK